MKKPISKGEKVLVYGFFIVMDGIQIILDVFVVTEIINHVLDIILGILLLLYGQKRKLWTGQKLLVLAAVFAGEQIPFVNAAPFWTVDVWNLYSGTHAEVPFDETRPQTPPYLNKDGVRLPQNPDKMLGNEN